MRRLYLIGGICAAVIALLFFGWRLSSSRTFQFFGDIAPRVDAAERVVALTFDDGPTPDGANSVLAMLRERDVKTTFFVIGAELEQRPELGQQIVKEGHELGNHSYSHHRMLLKTPSFIRDEIERTDRLIRDAGHAGPIPFRPRMARNSYCCPTI